MSLKNFKCDILPFMYIKFLLIKLTSKNSASKKPIHLDVVLSITYKVRTIKSKDVKTLAATNIHILI